MDVVPGVEETLDDGAPQFSTCTCNSNSHGIS